MIGYGFMGRAHSNAWNQVSRFFPISTRPVLKLVCGRNREALEPMAAKWGWQETALDWRAAIDRKDIDAVDIAAPNGLHEEIAIAAAQAGKIVLCEKPLAVSLDQARRMAAAVAGRPNMVWFNYRRVPAVSFAKELIGEDRVGTAFHYRATYVNQSGLQRRTGWKVERAMAGSGVIGDILSHVIDLALWLNSPVKEVCAMSHTFVPGREIEDAVAVLVRFANGSLGTFEATKFGVGVQNRNAFEIHGSNGMISFSLEDMNSLTYVDARVPKRMQGPQKLPVSGPDQPYADNFWRAGHVIGYEHTFIAALGDFLVSLEKGTPFHPDFEDGVRVQEVLDAVERSAASGSWVAL